MVRMPWAIYLWPGLPQLWRQGAWWGLALAVAFGCALNLLILASLVWVELLSPGVLRAAWVLAALVWSASGLATAWYGWGVAPRQALSADGMFRRAMDEYLQGNWFEAERLLGEILQIRPRDAEARLMLATLLRHNRRYGEALEQLSRLELLEDARIWRREIQVERRAIDEGGATGAESELEPVAEQPAPSQAA